MPFRTLLKRLSAAHALANACDEHKRPRAKDLKTLGTDASLADRFVH